MFDRRQFLLVSAAATAFGAVGVKPARASGPIAWDPTVKPTGLTLSNSDLTVTYTTTTGSHRIQIADTPITGKKVFEITYTTGLGYMTSDQMEVGVATAATANTGDWLGHDTDSAGFRPDGVCYYPGLTGWDTPDWHTPASPITVMVAIDEPGGKAWLYTGSGWIGSPGNSDDPETGTGGIPLSMTDPIFPAVHLTDNGDIVTANFGASTFVHAVPSGFEPLQSDYPLGVIYAGLEGVWDARPGMTSAPTQSLPTDAAAVGSIDSGLHWLYAGTPFTESDFDFDGYTVYANGGSFSLSNFQFRHNVSTNSNYSILLGIGHPNGMGGAADFALTDGVVDAVSTATDTCKVYVWAGSTLTATGVSFIHTNRQNIFAEGDVTLEDVYFDMPGQVSGGGHSENLFLADGVFTITRAFFDARDMGTADNPTAQVFVAPFNSGMTSDVTIEDSIFAGAYEAAIKLAISVGGGGSGMTSIVRLNNCVFRKGTSDYVGNSSCPGTSVTVIPYNCRDLLSGEIIDEDINSAIANAGECT